MSHNDLSVSINDEATIVLSGIGTEVTDDMLRTMYLTYGPIVRVRHNGSNSAQVVFQQLRHALKAAQATNGAVVYGKTLKVTLQRKFKKTTEPCRGFRTGICRKGDMCKYYHVTDNAMFARRAPAVAAKAPCESMINTLKPIEATLVPQEIQDIPGKQLCRHFSRGYCLQGQQCKFAHVFGLPSEARPASKGKVAQPCLFFQNGVCGRGDACMYVHTPTTGAVPAAHSTASEPVTQSSNRDNQDKTEDVLEQEDRNRTCVECEKPGVAVWKCAKCDNSLYCNDCNAMVHRARVMAKHKRMNLPPLPILPRCGECESKTASVRCEQCEVQFCVPCNASVHKFKSLQKHVRANVSGTPKSAQLDAKEPKQELKATKKKEAKKKETHVVNLVPQATIHYPVAYVESVPQLEFSSDSSETSESEDEEMEKEVLPFQSNADESMTAANSLETDPDEDFDDVKLPPLTSVAPVPVVTAQPSCLSSNPESEGGLNEKSGTKSTSASMPQIASLPDSDSTQSSESTHDSVSASKRDLRLKSANEFKNKAPSKLAAKLTSPCTPAVAAISSESESDSEEASPIHIAKQVTKPTRTTKMPFVSTNDSERETSSKAGKKKKVPASKSVETKASLASSSESSDATEDESRSLRSTASAPLRAPTRNNAVKSISANSSHTLVKKIEAYNKSSEAGDLHLDANLNGFERLLAHDCAERLGLAHKSTGAGLERHIIISRHGIKRPAAKSGKVSKSKKTKHRHF